MFKRTPRNRFLFFLFGDIAAIILAVIFAFLLRFEGYIPQQYFDGGGLVAAVVLVLAATIPVFLFFRLYSFTWSYVSLDDLLLLARGLFVSAGFVAAAFIFLRGQEFFLGFPRSVLLLSFLLLFLFMTGLRLSKRTYLQWMADRKTQAKKERTIIVGAGDEGEEILRSIMQSAKSSYLPVGFVDARPSRVGATIHGVRVLGKIEEIEDIVQQNEIEAAIIALPAKDSEYIKQAVELGRKAGLEKIQIVPPLSQLIGGQVSVRDLREVQVEDLLGREQVTLDEQAIRQSIAGKDVLVTGAAGSIGSELCRQIAKFSPASLLLLDQDETGVFWVSRELQAAFPEMPHYSFVADIRDKARINAILQKYKPHVIFHAAAYKHVPLMEEQADEAVKNNTFGTYALGELALKHQVERFVFVSTDKAVNPTSVMGASKRIGEMVCQMLNEKDSTKFVSVRFGNVLDSRGSVIPIFREQIRKGGPVTITHPDMQRYFMSTPEACLLVLEAGAIGSGGEVFVLDMGNPIKIVDLAKEMIRLSGYEPDQDIPIVFTGLRPGEKLFEDILTAEEGTIATKNEKIFVAKLPGQKAETLEKVLALLQEVTQEGDREKIIRVLQSVITRYTPFRS